MLPRRLGWYKKWYCSLSSPNVLPSVSFLSFSILLLMLFPFIIYLYFHYIFTIHFYLTPLLFRHLLHFTFKEDGRRNLLSCGLHCSGHFLINAIDKVIVYNLMWMQQATLGQKLPYYRLTSTLFRS